MTTRPKPVSVSSQSNIGRIATMLVLNFVLIVAGGWMIASFVSDCQSIRSAPEPVGQLRSPAALGAAHAFAPTRLGSVAEAER